MYHLITSTKRPKNGVHGIRFYIQFGIEHYNCSPSFQASTNLPFLSDLVFIDEFIFFLKKMGHSRPLFFFIFRGC